MIYGHNWFEKGVDAQVREMVEGARAKRAGLSGFRRRTRKSLERMKKGAGVLRRSSLGKKPRYPSWW